MRLTIFKLCTGTDFLYKYVASSELFNFLTLQAKIIGYLIGTWVSEMAGF